jgi:phage gpG-like protein
MEFYEISRKLKEHSDRIKSQEDLIAWTAGNAVKNNAIDLIDLQVSQGKTVIRYYPDGQRKPKKVTVSKEGDAPNTDTGRLIGSIAVEALGNGEAIVGSPLKYAKHLEFVHNRPWLTLAYQDKDYIMSQVKKVLK